MILIPKNEGVLQPNSQVGLSLVVINEFHNRSTVVSKGLVPPMCGGLCWKQVLGNTLNSIGSLLLSSAIDVSTTEGGPVSAKNQTLLQIQFFLFDRTTTIQLANSSFVIEPYLTKFSIGLFNWPWSQYGNSIEIRFSVQPNFTNYTRQNDSGITTFTIDTATGQIQLRLVDTVELDGQDTNSVQFDLDPGTSELVLTFPYFMSSLVYDPDLGVIFPVSASKGSRYIWEIIVAGTVSVGIAILIAVTVLGFVIAMLSKRRQRSNTEWAISVDQKEDMEAHTL